MKLKLKTKTPTKKYYFYSFINLNLTLYLIITVFHYLSSKEFQNNLIVYDSKINLLIQGSGNISLFSEYFYLEPNQVLINGIPKNNSCKNNYYIEGPEATVTLIFKDQMEYCSQMFEKCENIKEIDLSEFDFSEIKNMSHMFRDCINLEKIGFGKINTSLVENMESLFFGCSKLISVDLINFDTSSVINMSSMFFGCKSLKNLDLLNINTSNVESMSSMFEQCEKIISLNISNFDTTKVIDMSHMFNGCSNLKSLDLSNFNTSNVESFDEMFSNCNSFIYLNLDSFQLNNKTTANQIFTGISPNVKTCINDLNLLDIFSNISNISNCSDICFEKDIKLDLNTSECLNSCNDNGYNYEYGGICYNECPEVTQPLNNDSNLCVKIKNNDEPKTNYSEGYYFDINYGVYKKCFERCKNCNESGNEINNNCLKCKPNFIFLDELIYKNNCYEKCPFYHYFNESGNYFCTGGSKCPEKYNKLILFKNQCIDVCKKDNIYKYEFKNNCYIQCPLRTIYNKSLDKCVEANEPLDPVEEEKRIVNYKELITKGSFNNILDNIIYKNEEYNETSDEITYHITSTEIQKINKNNNISIIDLDKCEYILKDHYGLNYSIPLIIFKVEYKSLDTLIPMIEYEFYHPLNHSKLDLSFCNISEINLSIPVSLDENELYRYNPKSDYYTDECSSYTTEGGLDIVLSDRKKEYVDNKLSLCENNCIFEEYDKEHKNSLCKCKIKNKINSIFQMINYTYNLSYGLDLNENESDLLILFKCINILFSLDGLIKNISSYILASFILFFIISIPIFIKCGYRSLILHINKILKNKLQIPTQNDNSQHRGKNLTNNRKTKNKKFKKKKQNNFPPKKKKIKFSHTIEPENTNAKNSNSVINRENGQLSLRLNKTKKESGDKNKVFNKKSKNTSNKSGEFPNKKLSSLKKNIIKNSMVQKNFTDYEINTVNYGKAILFDNRTFCQYYNSLIKTKHPLLFAFLPNKDYNSKIIKICIFLLYFAFNYTINFFLEFKNIAHKLYEDEGKYDILYFIPHIFISFAISHIITIIIKLIFLTERNIVEVKNKSTPHLSKIAANVAKRIIKIKNTLFFIFGIIFLGFFWIILSTFGAVYKSTQFIILQNTLISFAISLIYPFIINIIPCIFRISAINSSGDFECVYQFNLFLQLL